MKNHFILLWISLLSVTDLFPQEKIEQETIRQAQQNVCAIRITEKDSEKTTALGCGVVLMTRVKDNNEYFIATAYHIVKNLVTNPDLEARISVFDKNGKLYSVSGLTGKHLLWSNPSMDAALMVLPRDVSPEEEIPEEYAFPGLANLKLIGEPAWGEDIYLFGYRWINENRFIDIVKKGILSVGTSDLPGYEGHLVYLIDNMANKGMSGGLAFNEEGVGIGIISSYVYETNNTFLNSDDLTVCLPLTFYFKVLGALIINQSDVITDILKEQD
ncbi:MAG: serine protease [Bacteroidetes bacterium]|nr:serine protease [Bacteroidota bacterium]